ncbi:hypothetical protein ACJZ2D_016979 [Fusarium nematophilum]
MTENLNTLSFVVSSGPKLQSDPQVRTLIRKHAMKNVAWTRKKRVGIARTNVGQHPPFPTCIPIRAVVGSKTTPGRGEFVNDDAGASMAYAETDLIGGHEPEQTNRVPPAANVPGHAAHPPFYLAAHPPFYLAATTLSTAYEVARSKFQVDLNDLSMLTNFNVGQGTASVLSYLQFVPSRYGLSPCLTAAADCLLARARSMLMPDKHNEAVEIRLHMVALRALHDALQNDSSCMSSEVLCASQLLGLHALLNSSQDGAWSHHVHGSIRLIKYRTPDRFKTGFDKALFAAHIGPIVFESLVGRKPCYLEKPRWMNMYQSLARHSDSLTEQSPLAIAIRSQMILLPRLWHDIDNAITGPELFNEEVQDSLRGRGHDAHQNLLDWMEDYKAHCTRMSLVSPSPQELAIRRELYGTAIECLMIVKRLLAAISDDKRQTLEAEAQALAQSLLELQDQPSPKHSWLFAGHEVGVAQSIVLTRERWEGSFLYASEYERKLASRERYITWAGMLGPV